jgi:hypothetical protein
MIEDAAIANMYAIEAVALFDHYHFRKVMQQVTAKEPPFTLWYPGKPGASQPWWKSYYDPTRIHMRDRLLFAGLPLPPGLAATKNADWSAIDATDGQTRPAGKKTAPQRAPSKKAASKKATSKKAAPKKAASKKAAPKKAASKKAAPKKAASKKAAPKKAASKKAAPKRASSKKATPKKRPAAKKKATLKKAKKPSGGKTAATGARKKPARKPAAKKAAAGRWPLTRKDY